MNDAALVRVWSILTVGMLSAVQGFGAAVMNKTIRVDHSRPVVVVSEKSVLLLEFVKEPISEALVSHNEPNVRHCRAKYRYRVYDGANGSLTNGQGVVEEIFQTVFRDANGSQVKDMGSKVGIGAGDFYIWWSEGGAGARSWLYYRTDSPVRFIQQPQHMTFDSVDAGQFQRYLASRNVQEFVSAGKTVQVTGPAVFSGELPTDTPTSARIESGRVRDGAFELKLSSLATNKHYIIESSFELKTGNWAPVHAFTARERDFEWKDPFGKDVNVMFYRIREGTY
jgi:hypothetical protein